MGKTVAFHTLGCKLNFAETSTIARDFKEAGFETVPFKEPADVYVINTCSVTENADKECRSIVNKALRSNQDGFVVVVGCYAQLKPKQILAIPGVDLVLGATEKFNAVQYLGAMEKAASEGELHSCEIEEANSFVGSYSIGDRTRAFLKVQDGCDYKCTYCTIPLARGISRSDSLENVLNNAQEITDKGIPEIVLTGVNVGDYGKGEFGNKRHEHTFFDLITALDGIDVSRLRISSIEPNLLRDETIAFIGQSKKFVPHFHLPLQSGSDAVLKKMKRRYMTDLYRRRVDAVKTHMPDAAIGVDVIVGFPGETEEDFLNTYEFINELDISYLHVFTYSERDNTEAAEMEHPVPMQERKRRNKMLRILSEKKRRAFYEQFIGQERSVLFEGENRGGYILGYTDNYIRVKTFWDPALANTLKPAKLVAIEQDGNVKVAL